MKPLSIITLLPSAAIAVGVTAIASQPSQASEFADAYYDANYQDWSYSDQFVNVPSLDRAYRSDAPVSHYAYYSIARPEYLL